MQLDDPRWKCAGCDKMMASALFFICRECIDKLSPRTRQMVMHSPNGQEAVNARIAALKELGAKNPNDVRVPPAQRKAGGECMCPSGTFMFEQRNLLTNEIDKVCDRCGKVRQQAKEMVKR